MAFSTPANTSGTVFVPTFNGSVTSYTITKADGNGVNEAIGTFSDVEFIGQTGLPGGRYVVTAPFNGDSRS